MFEHSIVVERQVKKQIKFLSEDKQQHIKSLVNGCFTPPYDYWRAFTQLCYEHKIEWCIEPGDSFRGKTMYYPYVRWNFNELYEPLWDYSKHRGFTYDVARKHIIEKVTTQLMHK